MASWRLSTSRLKMATGALLWRAAFSAMFEMYSPLTTIPHRIAPRRMKSSTIASPVSIPANTIYFLYYSGGTGVMYFPILPPNTGTNATSFTWYQGKWFGPYNNSPWAWRVNCRQVPQIGCTGVPTIGKTHTLTLSSARPSTQTFLAIGLKRLNPPFAFPGAPSCFLHTNVLALVALKTDAKGVIQFPEQVPNKPKLKGLKIMQQFAVVDAVNAAQLVFSAGSEIRL